MRPRNTSPEAPFQTIQRASLMTGLSPGYLRAGVKSGRIAHVRVGSTYLVNVPRLLTKLDEEAEANSGAGAAQAGRGKEAEDGREK